MSLDLMEAGHSPESILGSDAGGGLHPLSPVGVGKDAQPLERRMESVERARKGEGPAPGEPRARAERQMHREIALIEAWLKTLDLKFDDNATKEEKIRRIKEEIRTRMLQAAGVLPTPGAAS
jgi:hypothetical protein